MKKNRLLGFLVATLLLQIGGMSLWKSQLYASDLIRDEDEGRVEDLIKLHPKTRNSLLVNLHPKTLNAPVAEDRVEDVIKRAMPLNNVVARSVDVDEAGHLEFIKRWLANEDSSLKQRFLVLCEYAAQGYTEAVKLILESGVDVNDEDRIGDAALTYAAAGGRIEIVNLILEKGAKVNAVSWYNNSTALLKAADGGHIEVVKLLVAKGADVHHHDRDGNAALILAADWGHTEVVKFLLAETKAGYLDKVVALRKAAAKGHIEIASLLLESGADVNKEDRYGDAALTHAAEGGRIEIVDLVLAKGAEVNSVAWGPGHRTALWAASEGGHIEIVKRLVAKGADVHYSNMHGSTALTLAAKGDHTEVVKFLLTKGARPTRADLREAADRGAVEMEKLLANAMTAPTAATTCQDILS